MESGVDQANRARTALIQQLQSLQRSGVTQLRRLPPPTEGNSSGPVIGDSAGPPAPHISVAADREMPVAKATSTSDVKTGAVGSQLDIGFGGTTLRSEHDSTPMSSEDKRQALDVLSQQVQACTLCDELVANRTQTVFGVGSPKALLCFFGEGPGADEDRLGEPFVGRAGQLLNKIIEACTMRREDVYILNVVKCRPPRNRNPTPDEAENCRPFFQGQLEIIRPKFICCLGSVAAQTLLDTKASVGKLRGRFHRWRNVHVIVTYHPAYLLRNPSAKKLVWEDMQMLMKEMGIEIPKK